MTGLIVLDGHDRAGKSFLAQWFKEHCGATVYHCSYRFRSNIFAYHTAVLRRAVAESATRLVVIDRLWLSETIYGAVYRGGSRWPHQGRMFDRVLLRAGAMNVICATDPDHAAGVEHDKALNHSAARAAQVCEHFLGIVHRRMTLPDTYVGALQVAAWPRPDFFHYDYRAHHGEAAVGAYATGIIHRMQHQGARQLPIDPTNGNFLGHTASATAAMVGDRTLPKNHKVTWPFFDYNDSSLYLAKACHAADLDERSLVWLNAQEDSARNTLSLLQYRNLRFVALGATAAERLADWNFSACMIPHPRHAESKGMSCADYVAELKWAVGTP